MREVTKNEDLKKKKRSKGSFLLKIAILSFAFFVAFSLVRQQIEIADKKTELDEISSQLEVQEIKNDEIQHSLDQEIEMDEYAERAARKELNYAKPEEKIFVNIGGSD